jgi:hypothetical protein
MGITSAGRAVGRRHGFTHDAVGQLRGEVPGKEAEVGRLEVQSRWIGD